MDTGLGIDMTLFEICYYYDIIVTLTFSLLQSPTEFLNC